MTAVAAVLQREVLTVLQNRIGGGACRNAGCLFSSGNKITKKDPA
jgi:hypothetical protein